MQNNLLFDTLLATSLLGIWPRFVEPYLLKTTHLSLPLPNLKESLRLVQFSDLHLAAWTKDSYLTKLSSTISSLKPDMVLFTGDFICHSNLDDELRLHQFLNSLKAPLGCFASLGNHDYEKYVSLNEEGIYDATSKGPSALVKAIRRLLFPPTIKGIYSDALKEIKPHEKLLSLLAKTPFQLLDNRCIQAGGINIIGLGEFMLKANRNELAFANYDANLPGIILAHNPDTIPHLAEERGHIILSGHTHGCQINLPFFRERLTLIENAHLKRGLHQILGKWAYINRGVGATTPLRLFSPPEILHLTLETAS